MFFLVICALFFLMFVWPHAENILVPSPGDWDESKVMSMT